MKGLFILFFLPISSQALDLKDIEDKLEQSDLKETLQETLGIKPDSATDFLNWDSMKLSLEADMKNTTNTMGTEIFVDSKVYKRWAVKIRTDVKGGIKVPQGQSSIALTNFYMLRFPLKEEAFIVLPAKKSYMELDPEKAREMLGELKEKFEDKSVTIEKQEQLGKETIDGHPCNKFHVIMTLPDGTHNDVRSEERRVGKECRSRWSPYH